MEDDLAAYVTKMLSSGNLTQQQSGQAAGLLYVSNNIGRIADRCEEIAGVHEKITQGGKSFSEVATGELQDCIEISRKLFDRAIRSVKDGDLDRAKAQPEDETLVPFMNAKYILEVNQDSGIVEGDDFEIDDSEDYDRYVMKVLAPDGTTQMYLQGGERIVSRKETRTLIKKAKKAYENKDKDYDKYCKSLGKYIFKVLKGQNTRPPEYVEVPEGKDKNSNDEN